MCNSSVYKQEAEDPLIDPPFLLLYSIVPNKYMLMWGMLINFSEFYHSYNDLVKNYYPILLNTVPALLIDMLN